MLAVMLAMTGTQSVFAQNTGQRQRQMEQQMAQMQQHAADSGDVAEYEPVYGARSG